MTEPMKSVKTVELDDLTIKRIKSTNEFFGSFPNEMEKIAAAVFSGMMFMMQIMASDDEEKTA